MPELVTGGGFTFSVASVGGTWSWSVQANNVLGASQTYQIVGIMTPYGPLQDATAIPLPGDVVSAMADSLAMFQQQLNPMMALVSPAQTSFNVTITEGDPGSVVSAVPFQNVGALGSFMTVTATPDSQWLTAQPATVAGLGKNVQGQVQIVLVTAPLLAAGSPYVGHVNLQDNRVPSTLIPVTVQVNVLPRPQIGVSSTAATLTYSMSTGMAGGSAVVSVSNSGPVNSVLNFSVAKIFNNSPWLAIAPTSAGPLTSGQLASIVFSLIPANVPGIPGTYTENVGIISPNAGNTPVTVAVSLVVSA